MLLVLRSSSCCNDIPRTRGSTSVSTGRVSQSCFVILQGFSIPLPDGDPVLATSIPLCDPVLAPDSGLVPWSVLATRGRSLAAPVSLDSSLACRLRLRHLAKVVSLSGEPGHASQSVAKRAGGGDAS